MGFVHRVAFSFHVYCNKSVFASEWYTIDSIVSRSTIAPPNFSSAQIAGFKTSPRPYPLKYGAPFATQTSSFDSPLQTRKYMEDPDFNSNLPRVEQP